MEITLCYDCVAFFQLVLLAWTRHCFKCIQQLWSRHDALLVEWRCCGCKSSIKKFRKLWLKWLQRPQFSTFFRETFFFVSAHERYLNLKTIQNEIAGCCELFLSMLSYLEKLKKQEIWLPYYLHTWLRGGDVFSVSPWKSRSWHRRFCRNERDAYGASGNALGSQSSKGRCIGFVK